MSQADHLVLVIEDETPIRRFLRASLDAEGYRVVEAETGQAGLKAAAQGPPDLVILDLGLPGIGGLDVLRRLREWLAAPILILSAAGAERQKIEALDAGADDYLTKPFAVGELLARMRAALRHAHARGAGGAGAATIVADDLTIDLAARLVRRGETRVHLTPLEYKLLVTLAQHRGKVLTHRALLREVWGPQNSQETHYLRVFVANLRRKLGDDPIRPRFILTDQGVGYRFAGE